MEKMEKEEGLFFRVGRAQTEACTGFDQQEVELLVVQAGTVPVHTPTYKLCFKTIAKSLI